MLHVEQHRKPIMGSDMKSTMTRDEACEFRAAWTADVHTLNRMSRGQLADEAARHMITGPMSRDEYMGAILDVMYPMPRLNESTHVLHHQPGEVWDVCEWCNDGKDLAAAQHLTGAGA
jgi:hypothetical protein